MGALGAVGLKYEPVCYDAVWNAGTGMPRVLCDAAVRELPSPVHLKWWAD